MNVLNCAAISGYGENYIYDFHNFQLLFTFQLPETDVRSLCNMSSQHANSKTNLVLQWVWSPLYELEQDQPDLLVRAIGGCYLIRFNNYSFALSEVTDQEFKSLYL